MYFTIGSPSRQDYGLQRISEAQYYELKKAHDQIYWIFSLHEDYDIVLENYIELEEALFAVTLANVVGSLLIDRVTSDSQRRLICRRLSNFLEAISSMNCRLDKRTIITFGRKAKETLSIKLLRESICEASQSYRLVMYIRGFSQHADLPVQGISQLGQWESVEDDEKSRRIHTTEPYIAVDRLAQDNKIDSAFLETIKKRVGDSAALFPEVRAAMSAISAFLESIQKQFKADQDTCLAPIEATIDSSRDHYPHNLCAAKWLSRGHLVEDIHLTIEWRRRLTHLQKRHLRLHKLEKVEISSLKPV